MEFWRRLSGAFSYRDYRYLWILMMTGAIATWMRILGTAQWLLDETGSAVMVGMIGVIQLVIEIPSTLWAGTLADRIDRKRLLFFSYGLTMIMLLSLGVLAHSEVLTPVLVYIAIGFSALSRMLARRGPHSSR